MAINTLEYAKNFQQSLDKQMLVGATSGWMESNAQNVKYSGGDTVKMPEISIGFQLTANSCYLLTAFLTIAADSSLALVLLSKSSKSLDHMLRKEYTVYCFEILWIGHMLRYHTDGFSESPTTVSLLLC